MNKLLATATPSLGTLSFFGFLTGFGLFAASILVPGSAFLVVPAMLLLVPSLLYGLR